MSCAPFCSRPLYLLASGLRASSLPPTFSTAFLLLLLQLSLPTTPSSVPLLVTITFVSSGVRVTPTPPPLLPTSWRPARLDVCFLVTHPTTRGTVALTSPLAASLSPGTLCSTSRISLTPPPCFLTRWFSHQFPSALFLQVLRVHRTCPGGRTPQPGGRTPRTTRPAGRTSRPGDRTTRPGGRTPRPGGRAPRPGGRTPRPGGRTPRPGGRTTRPGGRTTRPGGRAPRRRQGRASRTKVDRWLQLHRSLRWGRPHRHHHHRLTLAPNLRCTTRRFSIGTLAMCIPW